MRFDYLRAPGAETCPDSSTFRNLVAARFGGRDPFTSGAARRIALTLRRLARLPGLHEPRAGGHPVRVSLLSAALAPCWHVDWFVLCGLLSGGVIAQETNRRTSSGHGAAGLRVGVEIPLPLRFILRVSGLLVPVRRRDALRRPDRAVRGGQGSGTTVRPTRRRIAGSAPCTNPTAAAT